MRSIPIFKVLVALLITTGSLLGQFSLGIKVGANIADTRVNGQIDNIVPEQTNYPGFTAGIVAEIPMNSNLSFRPEINFIQKGFTISQSFDVSLLGVDMPIGAKAKTRVNYLEVPLLLKYAVGTEVAKVYAIAGPSVSYATSAELRPVATLILDFNLPRVPINLNDDIYQRMEVSGVLGIGGEIATRSGKIFADARYNLGLTNMLNNPIVDLKLKNQGFNISAGYAHNF